MDRSQRALHLLHGRDVEWGPGYLVEGVWDGPFEPQQIPEAAHFFGSALLIEEDGITLVPSRALVDRLLLCELDGVVHVSNSLPLLLAASNTRLDPERNYIAESHAILKGIANYISDFPLIRSGGGAILGQQLYYRPVSVELAGRRIVGLDQPVPAFASFEEYREHMVEALRRIRDNAMSTRRRIPLQFRTTTSSGYDSAAVSVLAGNIGASITYTRQRSNSWIPAWLSRAAAVDDGTPVAAPLGLEVRYLESPSGVSADHELLLLAATTAEPETVFQSLARDLEAEERPTVLLTGYHGDKVWDRLTGGKYLSPDLIRGDTSGLNLGEIRLLAGFINVAVPFIGARGIVDLIRLANSPELEPWRLGTAYDRPIPRRIAEEAGVPRSVFGVRKKAVIQTYLYPKNRELRNAFFGWLEERHDISRGQVFVSQQLNNLLFILRRTVQKLLEKAGLKAPAHKGPSGIAGDLPHLLHHWATEAAGAAYARDLRQGAAPSAAAGSLEPPRS